MTYDDETVERVARAIYEAYPDASTWSELKAQESGRVQSCMGEARAALSALPAPADDALEALRELSERAFHEGVSVGLVVAADLVEPIAKMTFRPLRDAAEHARMSQSLWPHSEAHEAVRAKLAAPAQEPR